MQLFMYESWSRRKIHQIHSTPLSNSHNLNLYDPCVIWFDLFISKHQSSIRKKWNIINWVTEIILHCDNSFTSNQSEAPICYLLFSGFYRIAKPYDRTVYRKSAQKNIQWNFHTKTQQCTRRRKLNVAKTVAALRLTHNFGTKM